MKQKRLTNRMIADEVVKLHESTNRLYQIAAISAVVITLAMIIFCVHFERGHEHRPAPIQATE